MAPTRRTAGEPAIEDCADGNVMSLAAQAQGICLRLLTTRPRSRVELAGALRQRGISEEIGEPVLDRLGELGLVNDAALAEAAARRAVLDSVARANGAPPLGATDSARAVTPPPRPVIRRPPPAPDTTRRDTTRRDTVRRDTTRRDTVPRRDTIRLRPGTAR